MTTYKQKIWIVVVLLTIISGTVNGQTNVSGGIYANTTWTQANSPYIVVDTVVVFPNVTLTIESGVTVKFNNNKRIEIRQARLLAKGTSTGSITFTSNSASPSPGIWGEILVNGGAYTSEFTYCNFRYAKYGIYFDADKTLILRNSNFTNNRNGLYCGYNNGDCVAYIDSSNFINNTNYGIVGSITGNVNYCQISKNQVGMYGTGWNALIKDCTIDSNNTGIDVSGFSIDNCIIQQNQIGVRGGGGDHYIKNSTINNNSTVGLHIASDSVINCQITNNGIGFRDRQGLDPNVITRCIIEQNTIGIQSEGTNSGTISDFHCNRICNNTTFDLVYNVAFGSNAIISNNYWCTSDSATISGKIHDGYDDINLGLVDFTPIDTGFCNPSGCDHSISANIVNHINCYGDSSGVATVTTIGGTPPFSFLWSNGQTLDTVTGLSAGSYSVTVTDSSGCNVSAPVTFQEGTILIINTTSTNATCDTCRNGSATANLTNGVAPITYTWNSSPLQTTQTATGLSWGTYIVCAIDGNDCTACDTVFIDSTNCAGYTVLAQSNSASCNTCNDGIAWALVSGGTSPYNFTWYTNPIQTNDTATGLLQGTYVVCANDLYGCTTCDTVSVSIGNCSAFFDLYPDTIPHYYYAVNRASGILPLTYSWVWGDGSFDTVPFPSHTYSEAGFYTICLSITDSVGCTDTYCNSYYLLKTSNEIIQVNVIPEVPTGIFENSDAEATLIYPNPAYDFLNVELPEEISKAIIRIFNTLGQLEFSSIIASQKNKIDITGLADGVLIIEVETNNYVIRQKLLKQ